MLRGSVCFAPGIEMQKRLFPPVEIRDPPFVNYYGGSSESDKGLLAEIDN